MASVWVVMIGGMEDGGYICVVVSNGGWWWMGEGKFSLTCIILFCSYSHFFELNISKEKYFSFWSKHMTCMCLAFFKLTLCCCSWTIIRNKNIGLGNCPWNDWVGPNALLFNISCLSWFTKSLCFEITGIRNRTNFCKCPERNVN